MVKMSEARIQTLHHNDTIIIDEVSVDTINQQRLAEIDAEEYTYEGTVQGEFEEEHFPVEIPEELKEADHWAPKFLLALLILYAREKAPKAVDYLLRLIRKQEFSAE